jgi:hypothetical protein
MVINAEGMMDIMRSFYAVRREQYERQNICDVLFSQGAPKNVYTLQLAKYLHRNVTAKLIHTPRDDCET